MNRASSWGDRLSLVLGVSLPLALVGMFGLATHLRYRDVAPPRYGVLIIANEVEEVDVMQERVQLELVDGQVYARRFESGGSKYSPRGERLFYFDPQTEELLPVSVPASGPGVDDPEPNPETDPNPDTDPDTPTPQPRVHGLGPDWYPVDLARFGALHTEDQAPDGYHFDNSYRGSKRFWLMFDGHRYTARIERDGRAVKIPAPDAQLAHPEYRLVAWTTPQEEG